MPSFDQKSCALCGVMFLPIRESSRFCSISCSNIARAKPPVKRSCAICKVDFSTKSKKQICCSRKCGRALSETTIDKAAFRAAISAGKTGKPHAGVPHSEKTKLILSEKTKIRMRNPETNPFFGKKRTAESREKQSRTRLERIISGEYTGWFKRGTFESVKGGLVNFRSSREENLAQSLDDDVSVVSFQHEPLSIPYYRTEGGRKHLRYYIPDFLVTYFDGRKVLFEVKPQCFVDADINLAKFSAAREFCKRKGWEFQVWTQGESKI